MTRAAATVVLAAVVAVLAASPALSTEDRPTLAELESEVICPTCKTTLDQSSSPVALRMRAFIRVRIAAGDTKSEIKDQLVAQFGEQVLASPPARGFNLLAWVLPPVALVAGAAVVGLLAVRWSRRRGERDPAPAAPTADLDRRIDEELARFDS